MYHVPGITAPAKVCRSTWVCQERCTTEGLPGEVYFINNLYLILNCLPSNITNCSGMYGWDAWCCYKYGPRLHVCGNNVV